MSNRNQIILGAVTGTAIDLAMYAGVVAVGLAALIASVAVIWRRAR